MSNKQKVFVAEYVQNMLKENAAKAFVEKDVVMESLIVGFSEFYAQELSSKTNHRNSK